MNVIYMTQKSISILPRPHYSCHVSAVITLFTAIRTTNSFSCVKSSHCRVLTNSKTKALHEAKSLKTF